MPGKSRNEDAKADTEKLNARLEVPTITSQELVIC